MGETILRHGSDHIIEKPDLYKGHPHNDYGRGFYCTEDLHMAGEWACKQNTDGFINNYSFKDDDLSVLNFSDGRQCIIRSSQKEIPMREILTGKKSEKRGPTAVIFLRLTF